MKTKKKLGCAVIFMKYLSCVVSSMFLLKALIWNKMVHPASNLTKLPELGVNELKKTPKVITDINCSIQFISVQSIDFRIRVIKQKTR